MLNIALWVVGAAILAIGLWRYRQPRARLTELDRLAENAKRYDNWRGNRLPEDETTGADVMREMLRKQVITWSVVVVLGIALILIGFAIR
jgi:hypothetical protein